MRLAIISDIHSNILALEGVLRDIKEKDIDLTICLGDLAGYCTFPNEVINLIRASNIITIKGNYDEAVGEELLVCGCNYPDPKDAKNGCLSLNWAIEKVSDENKRFLRDLPNGLRLTFKEKNISFVHGSPRLINEAINEDSKEAKEIMEYITDDVLVCGHTHKPYYKMYGSKMLINAGSVGKPKSGNPDANYVIMDITERIKVEIVGVSYDFEKTARAIEEAGLPVDFANIIRTGKA